jgi:predicted acyltransferase
MLCGTFAGKWLSHSERPLADRLAGLFAVGAFAMMLGSMWHWVFPINKSIWTSSYVVFTAGIGAVSLATIMWIVDVVQWRRWTTPFVVYGINPMLAFLGSGLMARCISSLWTWETAGGTRTSAQGFVFNTVFASWLPPREASLAYAVSFVSFWFLVLLGARKRGFVLKV